MEQILSGAKVYFQGYDLSADISAVALKATAEMIDNTTLIAATRTRLPGLLDVDFSMEGFVNLGAGLLEETQYANIGNGDTPVMVCPQTGAAGEVSFFFRAVQAAYAPGAKVGDMYGFSAQAHAYRDPLVRGALLHSAARTASGNSAAQDMTNFAPWVAPRVPYAQMHAVSLTTPGSPAFTCKLQSASDSGFTYPLDVAPFANVSAVGGQQVAGTESVIKGWTNDLDVGWTNDAHPAWGVPTTHTWWRVAYTLTNITSITFVVSAGAK